ncbi:MAG TPA: YciI family protein [Humibacillus xanthopallidus]|nr:YciI family protein [Humibacillus xanthopallidus]
MAKYLIGVDFQPGNADTPMSEWAPDEVQAHLDYYGALTEELIASGELVGSTILTGPDLAKIVRSDGSAPVVTDGPFQEFKEWLAGFQVVEVESEERAIEIAARVSAVPGPGGVPLAQPIHVRRVMDDDDVPSDVDSMDDFLRTAEGVR